MMGNIVEWLHQPQPKDVGDLPPGVWRYDKPGHDEIQLPGNVHEASLTLQQEYSHTSTSSVFSSKMPIKFPQKSKNGATLNPAFVLIILVQATWIVVTFPAAPTLGLGKVRQLRNWRE